MRKIVAILIILLLTNLLIATEFSSKHIPPLNSEKVLEVFNNETERGREYYVFCDTLALEYEVEEGYEVYGFVRTIATDELEPDLNIYIDDTLTMLLSVLVDKSVKYTSEKYPDLSRAKKVYISPQDKACKLRLTTSSKLPLMIRMYKKKASLLNRIEFNNNRDLRS
ncbi:hypothetical protein JEZ13_07340 [bacterium]|nr:hypothetical protein [bacterium]